MGGGEADILSVGDTFHDRYEVVRQIGAGGMGAVYEVLDQNTQRRRALKVMLPSLVEEPELRRRFRAEATVAAVVESEHIAEVLNAGIDDETQAPFIVLELLKGSELADLLKKSGPMKPMEVAFYLKQTSSALDKAHAAGVVHRDLKPENLFVTYRDDGTPLVKILDFGIAKVVTSTLNKTATTALLGTPAYMATEQIDGDLPISSRTDGYAVGHIAYTLLVGEAFWSEELQNARSLLHLIGKIVKGPPEKASTRALRRKEVWLPPGFDAWFDKATASHPDGRFESAGESAAALAEALGIERVSGFVPDSHEQEAAPPESVQPGSKMPTVTVSGDKGEPVNPTSVSETGDPKSDIGTADTHISETGIGGGGSTTKPEPRGVSTGTSVSPGADGHISASTNVPVSSVITSSALPKRSRWPLVAGVAALATVGISVTVMSLDSTDDPAPTSAPAQEETPAASEDDAPTPAAPKPAPPSEPTPTASVTASATSEPSAAPKSAPEPRKPKPPIAAGPTPQPPKPQPPKPQPPKPQPPKPQPPKPQPPKPQPPKPQPPKPSGEVEVVVPGR